MTRTRKKESGTGWLKRMLDALRGGGIGLCAALTVLGAASVLVRSGLLSGGREGSAVIVACLLGGFAGGLFAVWRERSMSLPVGLGVGLVLFLLLLSAGVLFYQNTPAAHSVGTVAAACLCGGGLAGVLGRSGGGKKRRRR